jgi:hypothetical protein
MLTERRWHSGILHVRSSGGADYGSDDCMVVAEVAYNSSLCKQEVQSFIWILSQVCKFGNSE